MSSITVVGKKLHLFLMLIVVIVGSQSFAAQTPVGRQVGSVPINQRALHTGQTIRPTHWTGRPDYSKPYWRVNNKGHLIQMQPGVSTLRVPKSQGEQDYVIEGGFMKPIDQYGRVESGTPKLKLSGR